MTKYLVTFCASEIIESGKYKLPLAKQSFIRTATVESTGDLTAAIFATVPENSYIVDCKAI